MAESVRGAPTRRADGFETERSSKADCGDPLAMIELYQAEWCPHSHRVRQRLTELGLDFVAHQVPVDPAERTELERATGQRSIPTLVLDDGSVLGGDDEILAALDRRFAETPEAARHREKAVEEWPEWMRLARPESSSAT